MLRHSAHNVFILLVSLCIMTIASATVHAQEDVLFTVKDVKVDVTSDNAAKAREEAFAEAQMKAFNILVGRLVSEGSAANVKTPDFATVSTFVRDFELTEERLSSVRYIGTYTFRFKKDAIRNYVAGHGVSYSDVTSKPVLVLPFYQYGASTVLWDDFNPWMQAWQTNRSYSGLVPVVTPLGDAQDVSDIADNEAMTFKPESIEAMVDRYRVGEAIIMIAVPEWSGSNDTGRDPDKLTVNLYRTDRGRPDFARRITVVPSDAGNGQNIFDAAVVKSRAVLQDAWKQQTMTTSGNSNLMYVRVRFDTMQEWLQTRKALQRVQGVREMRVTSIKPSEARIEFEFQGSTRRLRLSLAQADLDLMAPQPSPYNQTYRYGAQVQQAAPIYELKLKNYQ